MKKLGRILAENGWVTVPQINQAIQHQKVFGGRLGTCLLELNLITEDRLNRALSDQANLPAASVEDLRNITETVLQLVPARMAGKSKVVPFDRYSTEVRMVMLNPRDLLLQDELAFVTSKRLKIFVAPEVRILEALEKYYNLDVDQRFQRIWDRLNRARYLWQDQVEAPEPEPTAAALPSYPPAGDPTGSGSYSPRDVRPVPPGNVPEWAPQPAPHLASPRGRGQATTAAPAPPPPPAEVAPAEPGPPPASPPPAPPSASPSPMASPPVAEIQPIEPAPLPRVSSEYTKTRPMPKMAVPDDLAGLEKILDTVEERDEIAEVVMLYLRQSFERVILFMVRGGEVAGWMGSGEALDESAIEGFELDFEQPSLFLNLKAGSPYFRGPIPRMPGHHQMAQLWGGKTPKESLALPVRLKKRLVAVVYCDNGRKRGLGKIDLGELQQVAASTGAAFESFLLRKKHQQG